MGESWSLWVFLVLYRDRRIAVSLLVEKHEKQPQNTQRTMHLSTSPTHHFGLMVKIIIQPPIRLIINIINFRGVHSSAQMKYQG